MKVQDGQRGGGKHASTHEMSSQVGFEAERFATFLAVVRLRSTVKQIKVIFRIDDPLWSTMYVCMYVRMYVRMSGTLTDTKKV